MTKKQLNQLRKQAPLNTQWILKPGAPTFFQLRPGERITLRAYLGSDVGISNQRGRFKLTTNNFLRYFEQVAPRSLR